MYADATQGGPWIFLALMIFVTIIVFVVKNSASGSDEDLTQFFLDLNFRQIFTIRAAAMSAVGFLILGVALWTIP